MAKNPQSETDGAGKETPLMKQYNAIKAKHPGTILLFRVGDFYETFGEDAVVVSKILGIVLTRRNNGGSDLELAGFPHHSLDNYLPKLVRAGQRVAVVDQLEDPKQAKGIVKRGVTELVTPGVAFSDKILESRQSNFLSAVHFDGDAVGLAFADVSTGEFFCLGTGMQQAEKLIHTLSPSEVLVPRKDMRRFRQDFGDKAYVTRLEDWVFQHAYAEEILNEHFRTKSLKGFGVENDLPGVVAAGALLHYLRESAQSQIQHVSSLRKFDDSDHVWLDPFTVRNLELVRSSHPDGKSVVEIIDHTCTPMGARLLRKWILFPLKDAKAIVGRQQVVEAFLKDNRSAVELAQHLKSIGDLERLVAKLATRRMAPREAMQLRNHLGLIAPISQLVESLGKPLATVMGKGFRDTDPARGILLTVLHDDPSNSLGSGAVVRNGVDAELDDLRAISENGKDHLSAMQRREQEKSGISSLKIGFNKVFGYYLEVTNVHKEKVPSDWIRKQTLTNAERYITDELKAYEDKILGAEEKITAIESRIYGELLENLQPFLLDIQVNAHLIAQLDVLLSFSESAKSFAYTRPEVHAGDEIDIRDGRHPVIERMLPRETPYIPNDVFLDNKSQQVIIITGPNMAGKSALLRQTALIVLLAQIGSFVPASSAKIGLVDKIFTRVGASDNISAGESTFMVEMNETARIVNNATPKSLILLDEIGRGTSTYDGVSIAWALVEFLHENKRCAAKTLFATHYHELNEISKRMERVKNYNVSVKELDGKVIFMRKLTPGGSEHSFGIHVAEMAGMPRKIVERASELLSHFEQNKLQDKEVAKRVRFSSQQSIQLNMFELKDDDTLKIRNILSGVDVDRMTPVEALLKLQEIKLALLDTDLG
jgi:DNA mismatch repair protein MutS